MQHIYIYIYIKGVYLSYVDFVLFSVDFDDGFNHNHTQWTNMEKLQQTTCHKLHKEWVTLSRMFRNDIDYFRSSSAQVFSYCLFSTQALIFFFSSWFYSICCPYKELSHCTLEFVSSSSLVFHTLLLSSKCGESFNWHLYAKKTCFLVQFNAYSFPCIRKKVFSLIKMVNNCLHMFYPWKI